VIAIGVQATAHLRPIDFRRELIRLKTSIAPMVRGFSKTWLYPVAFGGSDEIRADQPFGDLARLPICLLLFQRVNEVYVRDDRPFGGRTPLHRYSTTPPNRTAAHPNRHLVGWAGVLQPDAYAGYNYASSTIR